MARTAIEPRHGPRLEGLQLGLLGLLLTLSLAAWLVTDKRMQGMDAGPGTDPGAVGFYVGVWVVMMAAMMFPSISPMVRTYALVQRRRLAASHGLNLGSSIAAFVAGYILTWTAFGLSAYAVFKAVSGLDIELLSWQRGGRYLAGAVILAAALYQLTPLKDACLSRCRDPVSFLIERWRDGRAGALALGVEHGAWCVGCCWGLMAALFALGVMSIGWMAFVAALIAVEKMFPVKRIANRGIAVLLAALGLAVAVVPERVPGLMLPSEAMQHEGAPMGNSAPMQGGAPMDMD